jgi:hypothetical protein
MSETTNWAPERIYLQREQGEGGSHTWCEDSVGDGDMIEEVAYVRADVATPTAPTAEQIDRTWKCANGTHLPEGFFRVMVIDFANALLSDMRKAATPNTQKVAENTQKVAAEDDDDPAAFFPFNVVETNDDTQPE